MVKKKKAAHSLLCMLLVHVPPPLTLFIVQIDMHSLKVVLLFIYL